MTNTSATFAALATGAHKLKAALQGIWTKLSEASEIAVRYGYAAPWSRAEG